MWGFVYWKHLLGLQEEQRPYFSLYRELEMKAAEKAPHAPVPFPSFLLLFLQTWAAAAAALLEQSGTGGR